MAVQIGDKVPEFLGTDQDGKEVKMSDYKGKKVALYFYPKDNTAGCTTEAQGFRDHLADFKALGYEVLGVSRDSVKSHCSFRDKQNLNFPLLSHKEETVCNLYGVLKEKTMYGRKCFGIERSTFVIDPQGKIIHALRGVKAKTHVGELLELLKQA